MDKMTEIMVLPLPRVLMGLFYWNLDLMDCNLGILATAG